MKLPLFLVLLMAAAAAARQMSVLVKPDLPPMVFDVPDDEATGRNLLNYRPKDGGSVTPVTSFGWAPIIGDQKKSTDKSCLDACKPYNMRAVTYTAKDNTLLPLCRFTSSTYSKITPFINGIALQSATTITKITVVNNGGGWCRVGSSCRRPTITAEEASASVCIGSNPDQSDDVYAVENNYFCGCCGTINVKGRKMGRACPEVTALVASDTSCSPNAFNNKPWTSTGTNTGDVCLRESNLVVNGTVDPWDQLYGTVYKSATDGSLDCLIPFTTTATAGPWRKLCWQANKYP